MENSVEALISWGAEVDRVEELHGMTPLHYAVLSGNRKVVKSLIMAKADRFIRNKK